jgi:hypothetical protein
LSLQGTNGSLDSVIWSRFSFRFFASFCEHTSWNKLCKSTNFIIFGPTDQKLWKTKNLGEVWSRANHQELTTCAKKCGQEEEREFCKGGGGVRTSTQERRAIIGHWLQLAIWQTIGYSCAASPFSNYFILNYYFWYYEEFWGWAWHFGRTGVQRSHFLKSWEGEIFHSSWSLEISFFFKFYWGLKLEYTRTFIFTIGIFV